MVYHQAVAVAGKAPSRAIRLQGDAPQKMYIQTLNNCMLQE